MSGCPPNAVEDRLKENGQTDDSQQQNKVCGKNCFPCFSPLISNIHLLMYSQLFNYLKTNSNQEKKTDLIKNHENLDLLEGI